MRIGIDARLYNETGVGRYIRSLLKNLLILDKENNYYIYADKGILKYLDFPKNWKFQETNIRWHSFKEQLIFPFVLLRDDLDLMHFTYFSYPFFYNRKFIVTIHDLTNYQFPTGRATTLHPLIYKFKYLTYKIILKSALFNSSHIIVPSDTVSLDIQKIFKINKKKITTTYEDGFEIDVKKPGKKVSYENYLLYVGNVYPHKNVDILIKVLEEINKISDKPIKLLMAGKNDFFKERFKKTIAVRNTNHLFIFLNETNDEKLVALYKNAICLIFPSLAEGFGLPIMEAFETGCLVACSDIPVFREIYKDVPFYFDPNNTQDILKALNHIFRLKDSEKLARIEKARIITQRYSWKNMTKITLEEYKKLI